jgi:hypothetical protein
MMKIETSYRNVKIGVDNGVMVARECSCCHKWLPAEEFYPHPTGAYGRYARCKTCYKEKQDRQVKERQKKREEANNKNLQFMYNELLLENTRLKEQIKMIKDILDQ